MRKRYQQFANIKVAMHEDSINQWFRNFDAWFLMIKRRRILIGHVLFWSSKIPDSYVFLWFWNFAWGI